MEQLSGHRTALKRQRLASTLSRGPDMRSLTLVGAFKDFGDGDEFHALRDRIGRLALDVRPAVVDYLEQGVPVSAVPGYVPDAMDGSEVRLTRSHRTDGRYIWRHDLVHYVLKYGVALPLDFFGRRGDTWRDAAEVPR